MPAYTVNEDAVRHAKRLIGQPDAAGDRMAGGVEARAPGPSRRSTTRWVESRRAIVIGDSLIDNGTGLTLFDRWIPGGQTREQVLERLRPLLELVEIGLPHGAPTDRAALERALTWRRPGSRAGANPSHRGFRNGALERISERSPVYEELVVACNESRPSRCSRTSTTPTPPRASAECSPAREAPARPRPIASPPGDALFRRAVHVV